MNKKFWGIVAGTCAMFVFYITAGIIAAYLILNGIAGQTGETVSLFENWWQTLLVIADVIFLLGFAGGLTMFIRKKKLLKGKEMTDEER